MLSEKRQMYWLARSK